MTKLSELLILAAVLLAIPISFLNATSNATASATTVSNSTVLVSNSVTLVPQNLTLTNLSIPSNLSVYSPLGILFNVTNTGTLATGNITARISIYGNANYSDTVSLAALSPGQSQLVLLYLNNATQVEGSYAVYVDLGYYVNKTFEKESEAVSGYKVVNLNLAYIQPQQQGVSTIQNLELTSVPLFAYLSSKSSFLSQLSLLYNGSLPVTASIVYPSTFSSMLSFSARSLYIAHGQSLGTSILFTPPTQNYETTYIIPVNISVLQTGEPKTGVTRYMQFSVFNYTNSSASVSQQAVLYNNSQSAQGTIQVDSPKNYSLYNTKVELFLPRSAARYVSQISAFGSPTQITGSGSGYDSIPERWEHTERPECIPLL